MAVMPKMPPALAVPWDSSPYSVNNSIFVAGFALLHLEVSTRIRFLPSKHGPYALVWNFFL